MNRSFTTTTYIVAIILVLCLGAINWRKYFATDFHEQGDLAANALQIDRAKHGIEIYGNYSRFYFNHPGPAFFYCYALGEMLWHDWLHLCSSPHSAHWLAGLLVQSVFFGLALAVFQSAWGVRQWIPWALLGAAAHYGLAQHAFTAIWPPYALLGPFLCFFIACASVASGWGKHLPLAAVAGGFLVHGHVAQPLFVVSLFSLAYAGLIFLPPAETPDHCQSSRRWSRFPQSQAIAAVIIGLFLLPLVLDWRQWPNNNLHAILEHIRYHRGGHHHPLQALLYVLSFFSYHQDQEILLASSAVASPRFLLKDWGLCT